MGSTAAVICKGKRDSTRFLLKMLSVMSHRGSEAYGIATDNALEVKGDLKKLTVTESNVSIGYNFSKILPWDKPQPVSFNNVKLTFHGRVFPNKEMSESDLILGLFEREPVKEAELILEKLNGAYSFAALIDGKLIVGRDPLGLKPLYYGENHEVYAFATEKKALWSIGIKNVKSFPPGFIGQISNGRLSLKPIKVLKKPKTESISADKCIRHLKKLLYSSISDRIYGLKKVALAFSGGLDSSILAAIMKELGVDVQLIAVGSEGSHDYSWALEIAEEIGLPADLKIFKADDVRDVLPIVLWLIEDPNPLSLSIAVPFYFVAEESSN
ncbi:asparagine synthetase B, partial [Candidatus Bathyarchaeota archaeon]